MIYLNKYVVMSFEKFDVNLVIDIIGFGLFGYILEMVKVFEVSIEIELKYVLIIEGVIEMV